MVVGWGVEEGWSAGGRGEVRAIFWEISKIFDKAWYKELLYNLRHEKIRCAG